MDDFAPEQVVGKNQPPKGKQPSWEQYWESVQDPWLLAAKRIAERSPRSKALVSTYLGWDRDDPEQEMPTLDWKLLARDVDDRNRSDFSSSEKALGRTAAAVAMGSGRVDFRALSASGDLAEILTVIAQAEAEFGRFGGPDAQRVVDRGW